MFDSRPANASGLNFWSPHPVREGRLQRPAIDADRVARSAEAQPLYAGVAQCIDPGCDRYGIARLTVDAEP